MPSESPTFLAVYQAIHAFMLAYADRLDRAGQKVAASYRKRYNSYGARLMVARDSGDIALTFGAHPAEAGYFFLTAAIWDMDIWGQPADYPRIEIGTINVKAAEAASSIEILGANATARFDDLLATT